MRPTRHYTIFLSEDSSGDELQSDDDSVAALTDHASFFSASFDWSPLYAPSPPQPLAFLGQPACACVNLQLVPVDPLEPLTG